MFKSLSLRTSLTAVLLVVVTIVTSCHEPSVDSVEQPKVEKEINTEGMYAVKGILSFKTYDDFNAILTTAANNVIKDRRKLESKFGYTSLLTDIEKQNKPLAQIDLALASLINTDQLLIIGAGLYRFSEDDVKLIKLGDGAPLENLKNALFLNNEANKKLVSQVITKPIKRSVLKSIKSPSARVGSVGIGYYNLPTFPEGYYYGIFPCETVYTATGDYGVSSLLIGHYDCIGGSVYNPDCNCYDCNGELVYSESVYNNISFRTWTQKKGPCMSDTYDTSQRIRIYFVGWVSVDGGPNQNLFTDSSANNTAIFGVAIWGNGDNTLHSSVSMYGYLLLDIDFSTGRNRTFNQNI